MIWVAQEAVAHVMGELGGFGLNMCALGAVRVHACDIKVLQDIEHQDCDCAVSVRWMLNNL